MSEYDENQEFVVEGQTGGVRGDLNYRLIVMRQLDRVGQTLAKLPHEGISNNSNVPLGCTYEDIERSFFDGVRLLEALLYPYFDNKYTERHTQIISAFNKKNTDISTVYFSRYANVISLCARLGLLLEPIGDEGV